MKKVKVFLTCLLVLSLLVQLFLPFTFAEDSTVVIYLDGTSGNDSSNGLSSATAKKTLSAAVDALEGAGGVIVICGNTAVTSNFNVPAQSNKLVITGKWQNVDYGSTLTLGTSSNGRSLYFNSETEISHLTLQTLAGSSGIFTGPSLTISDGVTTNRNGKPLQGTNDISIRLGLYDDVCQNAVLNITSGTFSFIQGGNNRFDVGNSTINFGGTAKVITHLQGGGTGKNVTNSVINITGGIINNLFIGGYGANNLGTSQITISGGTVNNMGDGRDVTSGQINGPVSVTISDHGQVNNFKDINKYNIMAGAVKNLTFSNIENGNIDACLSLWSTVKLTDNSTVNVNIPYTAPINGLIVETGSHLILNSEAVGAPVPTYSGGGLVTINPDVAIKVIYVDGVTGSDKNDGLSPATAKKTLSVAVNLLEGKGGVIVICGDTQLTSNYTIPVQSSKLTITGKWQDVDYGSTLIMGTSTQAVTIYFQSNTEINHIKLLAMSRNCGLWTGPLLTISEGTVTEAYGQTTLANSNLCIRLGSNSSICENAVLNISDGTFSYIHGGNNRYNVVNSTINFSGNARVISHLQGGGTNKNVTRSFINISGGEIMELFINGYGTANLGSSVINISGGRVSNLTDGRANASASPTGKVTGEVTVTVSGSGQLDSYVALNQYGVMANATKNLIFIDVPRASVDVSLNQWSNVTLKGTSRVYATVPYSAPSKSLNIDHGSQLILMEDQVIPSELQNYGDRIVLGQYSYDFENENYYARKYMKGSSGQAISIFGDKVFMFNSNGLCNVYDLSTKSPTPIATFPLGSYNTGTAPDGSIDSRYANHCNTAMFSNTFYQGNNIPLLYVTSGNSGDYDEDGYIGRCAVENISVVNGQYSSQLVQTIIYNPNHPSTDSLSAKGWENPCWGSPQSFVDTENGWYYLFSTRYRTNNRDPQIVENNCYIITKFQLPQVTESNTKVILVADDIVDQFTIPFEAFFTQGGTLYNNKIYFLFGCGEINGWPNSLLVFNLEDKLLEASIDLSDSIFRTEEPEGAAVYNGKLMINTAQGYICQFDYVESNWIDLVDGGKKTIDCLSGETLLYISP